MENKKFDYKNNENYLRILFVTELENSRFRNYA